MGDYKKHDNKFKKVKRYTGGRHVEIHENANPDAAMKKLQRWLKEENYFIAMREREEHVTASEKKRKAHHLAVSREEKRWKRLEEGEPGRTKSTRSKSNRGKKTSSRMVKKPND